MEYMWDLFVSMLMLVFAIGAIIAGLFTAYFGSGKSRAIGGVLLIIGLIFLVGGKYTRLGRLPGDIRVQGKQFSFFFPVITCIVVSIVLTLILNIVLRVFRR